MWSESEFINILRNTVSERFKAWNVFAHVDAGTVGSNPTMGMDV
jgi:hypothetical protein